MKEQQEPEQYKPGAGIIVGGLLWGIFWMVGTPIIVLLMVGGFCAVGLGCFFADHNMATGGVSAVLGFLCGFAKVYARGEDEFKKKQAEDRQRRLEEAQLRWLEQQEENNP